MTREEAIENLKGCICGYEVDKNGKPNGNVTADLTEETIDMAIKALEQRWIPVSERLPEEDKQVLVTECFTTISGEKIYSISLANFYGDDWVTVHDEYKIDPSRHKVIAWRELPETYKAESEEV